MSSGTDLRFGSQAEPFDAYLTLIYSIAMCAPARARFGDVLLEGAAAVGSQIQ